MVFIMKIYISKWRVIYICLLSFVIFAGCDQLNVVPRNNPTYSQVFNSKSGARNALHGLYSYIPPRNIWRGNASSATDEFMIPKGWGDFWFPIKKYWTGAMGASSMPTNYWGANDLAHAGRSYNLYKGIRYCYTFLNNLSNVPNLSQKKKESFKGQANFLIGYYYFILFKYYGPVILREKAVSFNANQKKIFAMRATVDSTVNFIVGQFNKAIDQLPSSYADRSKGKPTSIAAKAMKAKVLMFAASPFYNGKAPQMFEDLKGPDGKFLFPQSYDQRKWKKALNAVGEAINAALSNGYKLYYYKGSKPKAWNTWNKREKAIATNLFKIVKRYNSGTIWGFSNVKSFIQGNTYQWYSSIRTSRVPPRPLNSLEVTINAASRFLTKDGLPISKDPNYDYTDRFKIKPGDSTAYMNRDRGPRFYASIGFDRGKAWINGKTFIIHNRYNEINGVLPGVNDDGPTGYELKKFTNPNTFVTGTVTRIRYYPFPLIRLARLYLFYAEAYNEIHGGLAGKALKYFNSVRKRGGIPTLTESWSKVGGVPISKAELRKIIHRAEYIEFAFGGRWYFDMRRWGVAGKYMSKQAKGWNVEGSTAKAFTNVIKGYSGLTRGWSDRQYLLPIPINAININPNLVQNPGY